MCALACQLFFAKYLNHLALQPNTGFNFDVYDIPDALFPQAPWDPSVFLNDNRTIAAMHAPTNQQWVESSSYPFGSGSFFAIVS